MKNLLSESKKIINLIQKLSKKNIIKYLYKVNTHNLKVLYNKINFSYNAP